MAAEDDKRESQPVPPAGCHRRGDSCASNGFASLQHAGDTEVFIQFRPVNAHRH
jgi:hypothetical protein